MVRRVPCTAADAPALFAFLERHASTSLFLLENLRNHGISQDGPSYVLSRDDETLRGVASVNTGGVLILQAAVDAAALSSIALEEARLPVRGILGPTDQVSAVLDGLLLRTLPARMHSDERLYALDLAALVVPAVVGGASVRVANEGDLKTVTAYRRAYAIEALGATDDAGLDVPARADAERNCRDGNTFVLVEHGNVVGMTSFTARHNDVVQIGGVFTPKDLRGRGYARIVVAGSLVHARTQGKATNAVLFTAENNRPAQRAYEALGFRHSGGYTLHFFREPVTHLDAPPMFARRT